MINCIVIEDEPLAQLGLLNLIKPFNNLKVIAVCDDVSEYFKYRETHKDQPVDLIFLDIELPGMSGIDFIRKVPIDAPVVLTTAYNQYAIEGFELNVLDYLLKPISKDRFAQTVAKTESYLDFQKSKKSDYDFIYVKSDKVIEKVLLSEIVVIEAMRNYVIYHCDKRKLISYNALKNVEQDLPPDTFIKIQKSFIVNKKKIDRIEKGYVFIADKKMSINRENKNLIIKRLLDKN